MIGNRGKRAVALIGSKASCSCVSVTGIPQTLEPGKEGQVGVQVLAPDRVGHFREVIVFYSDSSTTPALRVEVTGNVDDV